MRYLVPEPNMARLVDRLEAVAKRARKLGLEPPCYRVVGGETRENRVLVDELMGIHRMVYQEVLHVEVTGEYPRIAGWTFAAAIDYSLGPERPVALAGGDTGVPERYWTTGPVCEHCRVIRRRKLVYLVHHEDGQWQQVGSTCVMDFLGSAANDPEALARAAEHLLDAAVACREAEEESDGWATSRGGPDDLASYLALVAGSIRVWGWVSRTEARETGRQPTADHAAALAIPEVVEKLKHEEAETYREWSRGIERDQRFAAEAISWVLDEVAMRPHMNDYLRNLVTIAEAGQVADRVLGLAASMIYSYSRHLDRQAVKSAEAELPPPVEGYFGQPKKRMDFRARILGIHELDGLYGTTYLIRMLAEVDGAYYMAVWFSSRNPDVSEIVSLSDGREFWVPMGSGLARGETVWLKGTIKKHERYRDQYQTVLTRCVMSRCAPEDNPVVKRAVKEGRVVHECLRHLDREAMVERVAEIAREAGNG